jgi:anti-sigma-K factor RskA
MSDEHKARDLLPGYSLGILEEGEKNEVREHLALCPSCRVELASFREVTGRLSAAVPRRDPPAGLEGRILEGIAAAQGAASRNVPRHTAARHPAARHPVPPRRFPWPSIAAVAAMCAVALGVGNFLQWNGVLQPRTGGIQSRLMTAVLTGTGDAHGAYGTIVLDPMDNKGVLAVTGLHGLDKLHQYQLWLIKGGQRRSAGVFSPDAEGYGSMLLSVPPDFKDFRAFGVSIEPWGGSPAPTGPRVLAGAL